MKKVSPANNSAVRCAKGQESQHPATRRRRALPRWKTVRSLSLSLLLTGVALMPMLSPLAQGRKDGPAKVTGVSSSQTRDGAVVTIAADSPLTRTQTWQDDEGFHVTLPNTGPGAMKGLPRGVIVRNLGKSLEVVVAVKPGAGVTVDPQFNRLNLIVKGGVDTSRGEAQLEPPASRAPRTETRPDPYTEYEPSTRQPRERRPLAEAPPVNSYPSESRDFASSSSTASAGVTAPNAPQPNAPAPLASPAGSPLPNASPAATPMQIVPTTEQGVTTPGSQPAAQADLSSVPVADSADQSGGFFSYVFSTAGVLVMLLAGFLALMFVRRRQEKEVAGERKEEKIEQQSEALELVSGDAPAVAETTEVRPRKERRKLLRRKTDKALARASAPVDKDFEPTETAIEKRSPVQPVQPALYGAYRVDQEVGKLVLGQAHRMDVLASRAPDDRRAIETSLLKALTAAEVDEDGRRRARAALEEYGFVARQCASLLLAHNAYDRASSARVLGEIGAQSAMPFLLEALYDGETIVRTEAVTSLGSLRMPSAIGALLDMARRHPEMPATLLSRALSACSVECFDIFDSSIPDRPLLDTGDEDFFASEITHLDPVAAVEALPEWFEDEELTEALARLGEADVEARAAAARRLAQFPVQRSVEALTLIAASDPEAAVRAAAVASLGEIEHESVFAPVLMGFADEAREVRAAAARSLSRMSYDRAEGYVRLIETADADTLGKVARACVTAGIASQAIERLISEDRRLAYESFSLLSLLAKAGEVEPLMDAISEHPEVNVRLALVRLLGTAGQPEVSTQLRHLAVRDGMPEKVRTSLLEVVYKLDQTLPV